MPHRVFVDTSAWIAVADTNESHHKAAVEIYAHLLRSQVNFATTILVVAETQAWLRRRMGVDAALSFLKSVNESPRIEVVYPNARLEAEAKRILRQFTDQDFSLTDAISFACMKQMGLKEAFTYDNHFATAGLGIVE